MSVEVLLMQDMPNLGPEGTVVKVADGYARNYLFPQHIAEPVTEAARRRFEKIRKEHEAQRAAALAAAKEKAAALKGASVSIRAKTSDGENLYGSVTAADIAAAITETGTAVDRAMVLLDEPIKVKGEFNVDVKFHADVVVPVKVWVVEE